MAVRVRFSLIEEFVELAEFVGEWQRLRFLGCVGEKEEGSGEGVDMNE